MTEHRRVVAVFRMLRESIAGRSVVLVDDFVISGATLATQSSVLSTQFHVEASAARVLPWAENRR
jgi:hypoxanthine-guanine phosphoribosyltransferase